jgi:hypothetical protein
MAVAVERSADATAIRPLTSETPQSDLDDLRARIEATRWPEKEPVEDRSQGVQAYPKLIHFNEVDRGGHIAAWDHPELFVDEVRTGLRSLR